jgi:uracil-DNA glycosylase
VLLLNATLTVERGRAGSHQKQGWEIFTDAVIAQLSDEPSAKVFLLWGRPAQEKGAHINTASHLVLTAPHPSPLSAHRGFFDCAHFSRANQFLKDRGRQPIDWQLPD